MCVLFTGKSLVSYTIGWVLDGGFCSSAESSSLAESGSVIQPGSSGGKEIL